MNEFIKSALEEAGFSSTYEHERLEEFSENLARKVLVEFYINRFNLHGADIYEQIEDFIFTHVNNNEQN